jgi:hypothetical protein
MTGIKTSCIRKRKLYLACRNSTNPHIKGYYKRSCNILSKVIKKAKKHHYDNQMKSSTNRNKTTWNTVNKETNRIAHSTNIKLLILIVLLLIINNSLQRPLIATLLQ